MNGHLPSYRQTPSLLLAGINTAMTFYVCACGSHVYFSDSERKFFQAYVISMQTVAPLHLQQYKYLEDT